MGQFQSVHKMLRQRVGTTSTYNALRRVNLLWAMARGEPHEADYLAFPKLAADEGVFLDIGANAGQTAAGISKLLPRHKIISFEPNPSLWSELAFIQKRVGARMEVRKCGLGQAAGTLTLHIPVAGDLAYEARASVLESEARQHAETLSRELGRAVDVKQQVVEIMTLDSLDLAPDLIKIDVEGFEMGVLLGAEATLMRRKPILLMERNDGTSACRAWLTARGYSAFAYDHDAQCFTRTLDGALNMFAAPLERLPAELLG